MNSQEPEKKISLQERIKEDVLKVTGSQIEVERLKKEMTALSKKNEKISEDLEKWARDAMQIMQKTLNDFKVATKNNDTEEIDIKQKTDKHIFLYCALISTSAAIVTNLIFKLF